MPVKRAITCVISKFEVAVEPATKREPTGVGLPGSPGSRVICRSLPWSMEVRCRIRHRKSRTRLFAYSAIRNLTVELGLILALAL